ncbi:hypothetical protein [Massilia sp. PWRC2]|uniref:hypothetical protein n=1 Tax=Massilia sp. PWRC2 TaxID=2804626 RepID=UPI003CFA9779
MQMNGAPAFQAYLQAHTAFTAFAGDASVRALDAWREISAVSWRLARQHLDASSSTLRALLDCRDPLQPAVILASELHPTIARWTDWQERVLDLLGGAQAAMAASAEAYVPAARYAAAPLAD